MCCAFEGTQSDFDNLLLKVYVWDTWETIGSVLVFDSRLQRPLSMTIGSCHIAQVMYIKLSLFLPFWG